MSNTSVQSVAVSVTRKFGRYECKACADALETELRRIGVSGYFLTIEALSARPFIVMKDSRFELPWPGSSDETIKDVRPTYAVGVLAVATTPPMIASHTSASTSHQ